LFTKFCSWRGVIKPKAEKVFDSYLADTWKEVIVFHAVRVLARKSWLNPTNYRNHFKASLMSVSPMTMMIADKTYNCIIVDSRSFETPILQMKLEFHAWKVVWKSLQKNKKRFGGLARPRTINWAHPNQAKVKRDTITINTKIIIGNILVACLSAENDYYHLERGQGKNVKKAAKSTFGDFPRTWRMF